MLKLSRLFLVKAHIIMASLTLILMMMFFITGALYTYGYKPSTYETEYRFEQDIPLEKDMPMLLGIVVTELERLQIKEPFGTPKIKRDKKRHSYKLVWSGKNRYISLRPSGSNPKVAVMIVEEYSWYYRLMRLHKAKGPEFFEWFTIISSAVVMLILLSGVIIGIQAPGLRKITISSLAAGMVLFFSILFYVQFY